MADQRKLLPRLYAEVGNGGFGPGYGLFGVPCGPKRHKADSFIKYFFGCRKRAAESELDYRWPEGLLPICEWGCGIRSSLNCTRPETPVIRHDPNMEYEDFEAELAAWQKFEGDERLFGATWIEAPSLYEWLQTWLERDDLFLLGYPPPWRVMDDEDRLTS